MKTKLKPEADFLIEVLHEVANPIGGVYSVIVTKSAKMRDYYGDNYWTIGAYYPKFAQVEFDEMDPPEDLRIIFEQLSKENIQCHYGIWLIPGKPKTILIDYTGRMKELTRLKQKLLKEYGIDADNCGRDLENQIVWSDCISKLFENLLSIRSFKDKKGVVSFHLSDPGLFLLDLAKRNAPVGIMYTAHSTRLGRYIVINKEDLLSEILNNKKKTVAKGREKKYGGMVKTVHQFERACANVVDVFTSVSEVTAKEAEYILGRKTDVVTPNGLDISSFPSLEDRAVIHNHAKNRIYRFLNAYFLPYYSAEVKDSLLFFISGRYELGTKGYDIFFDALSKLNKRLKSEGYDKNIFVFLFIMTGNKEPNDDILKNMAIYEAIEHEIEKEYPHIHNRIMNCLIQREELKRNLVFDDKFLINTRKLIHTFTQTEQELPPICAFEGVDKNDQLMKKLNASQLNNEKDDKVKVIFYPAPVSVADGLLSMEYDYVTSGMHLGVFPSLYEPWGYTPLETAAQGVSAITTDGAGFGKFILKNSDQRQKPGIILLRTEKRKREQIVDDLAKIMYWFSKLQRKERIEKKLEAHKLASLADWDSFAKHYVKAHNLAVKRCMTRQKKK